MQQQRNLLVFFLVVTALMFGYISLRQRLFPPSAPTPTEASKKDETTKEGAPAPLLELPKPTTEAKLLHLGDADPQSRFHLHVVLDPLGAGVRSVTLNKFRAADSFSGKPVPQEKLDLVPASANLEEPSHLLYHYPHSESKKDRPLDTLGRVVWNVVPVEKDSEDATIQKVSFRTQIDGVELTKTYTLRQGDYHIGLEVHMKRLDGKPGPFRYQLTGAKGLPVEGKWYTGTFRNAIIAREDTSGYVDRHLQDLRQLSLWAGGRDINYSDSHFLRYAGIAVQYFASVVVVDEQQSGGDRTFLSSARPTIEKAVTRGLIKKGSLEFDDRLVLVSDDGKNEQVIYLPRELRPVIETLRERQQVAVVYRSLNYDDKLKASPKLAIHVETRNPTSVHALWEDDVTVRVATKEITLEPGEGVTHRYVLYNGPVKPSLLRGAIDDPVLDNYIDKLKLNTLTDYQSSGFTYYTGFSYLVINTTNLMHWVLGKLHIILPSFGLSIICLTLLVRLIMFPLSRKQAVMSLRMQTLQPELKKLSDRYKDDKQAFAQAQMELFRQHGVNPFGSCWVLLLQMPIFMGLYFALQESIQFRLAPFWPTWITNLAAPDMLFEWGRWIPWISSDDSYGGMFYLGPYFNLLPLITVTLMVIQQKLMTPPPADKEQEFQQKTMRIMMIVFGLFFYKLAAGLCIYIITSTLWGFAERKLLPKSKQPGSDGSADAKPALSTAPVTTAVTAGSFSGASRKGGKGRRKDRGKSTGVKNEEPRTRLGKWQQQVSDWWKDVLEQARKK